jgi:chorismate mutase
MSLDDLRAKINDIDSKILALLGQRAKLALETSVLKKRNNGAQGPVYVPAREREIITRLTHENTSDLNSAAIEKIFQSIIESCRNLQALRLADKGDPITISVQGKAASFSEQAGEAYIQYRNVQNARIIYGMGSQGVLDDLTAKKADLGLMAINNTWGGLVQETLTVLTNSAYEIVDTIAILVSQNLMSLPNIEPEKIEHIYSHPQALKQCRDYLAKHYPGVEQHQSEDTAKAAQDLALGELKENSAVIGSKRCVDAYGLNMLAEDIQDIPHNETLFFVVKKT